MSTPESKIVVAIETLLRGMPKASKDVARFEKQLRSLASIRIATKPIQSAQFDKAALAAQKLLLQQQKLAVQTQELANRQERARQATERLAQAQARLNQAQERSTRAAARPQLGAQQDAHIRAFRALESERIRIQRQTDAENRRQQQAADSLQRQRSAALIAEKNRRTAAAESLQRQRSSALIKDLRDQEKAAERTAEAFRNRFQTLGSIFQKVGQSVTSLGATLSVALTAPLAALGIIGTRNAVTLDSLTRGLTAITGSAQEASIQLARLTEIAKLPGIGFQEAIQGSIRLQAVGFSAEVAERALRQFANAIALTGGGREELDRVTVQLGQLAAKGKVVAQDLKPIIEAGPAVGRALLQAFGTVNSEDIQKLGLTSQQFTDQLLDALEKLPRAAAGARNSFENFSDALFRATSAIGQAILPVLTSLIETIEPIITKLARGFSALPPVIQTLIVLFGGLAAALGPSLFLLGQLISTVGSAVTAFARLAAVGLTPTIEGFRLLIQVMRGSASLMAGQAATTAAAAGGWIALAGAVGAAVAVLAVVGIAIAAYSASQKEAVKISNEQIAATKAQIDSLQSQVKFLDGLKEGVERTADEQERLAEIYASLNVQAKIRTTAITDEEKRLAALREELNQILQLRKAEQVQQAANLAASLADTAQQIQASQQARDAVAERVQANTQLAEALTRTGKITVEQSKQLAQQGINAGQVEDAIGALNAENEALIDSQGGLIKSGKELNGTAEEQGAALKVLAQQTGLSARELLSAAKAMGLFKGNVEAALPAIERFIASEERAAKAADSFTEALRKQNEELLKAGKEADDAAKQRNDIIKAAVSLAKEASNDLQGALKFLKAFIAANPDLRAAIEKERQLAGKSFEEFIESLIGVDKLGKRGTALRNAQQQLADALLEVASANAEKLAAKQKTANDALLEANERSFALQLISYRQYLEERARLTQENLDVEIVATLEAVTRARAAQSQLLKAATKSGIPEAERTKRKAQVAEQEEKAVRAETRLAELEARRIQIAEALKQALAESAIQQEKDVRQLAIEFAELDGKIEDALNTATIERFRESLLQLGKSQDLLNKQLAAAKKAGNKDRQVEIENALKLNQSQIDLIELIKEQEFASNKLVAAQEFVRRAKDKQAELERQIGFEVENRGLKEGDAIRKRLEGERKLADSLRVVRDLIQSEIDQLNAKGVNPPQALLDFIRDTNAAIQGLGELPFSEQFRLVEKEFNRINDERIRKIQDVERAVRNRTIAEVEGQIIIRKLNNQYTADLEAQLVLLRQIAEASGQEGLKRQADDAAETVKDTKDQVADLGRQIESAGKDAFRSGLGTFFKDLITRAKSGTDAILDLLNSVADRVTEIISENLADKLFKSLFGDGESRGFFAKIGLGGAVQGATQAAAASSALATAGTAAGTALTTGGTAAGTALTTGGATAATTLVSSITAAAASFAATVAAAGAAFAAAVSSAAAANAFSGVGNFIPGNAAATGLFPAVPGGAYKFVEGGYPEAVLTTDPKHAARQFRILRAYLAETKGLFGRIKGSVIPGFESGAFITPRQTEMNLLDSITRGPSPVSTMPLAALARAGGGVSEVRLRQILVAEGLKEEFINSPELETVIVTVLHKNQHVISRMGNRRG